MPGDQLHLPHLDATALAEVATALLRLPARPGWPDPPFLLALPWGDPWRVDDLGFDLEARPLGDISTALDILCHQRPKPEWVAVGVVVEGWTVPAAATGDVDWRTLRRNGPSLRAHPQRRRVRTLHMVARGGPVALAMVGAGDLDPEAHTTEDGGADAAPTGPLPDGLRRLLGLATPPCPVTALELWASLWLAAVAARARHRRSPMGWSTVAALHPGAHLLRRSGGVDPVTDLVPIGRALARAKGWDALQLAAVAGGGAPGFLPPPEVSAWADAGMFARLVLREVEPLWASRQDLEQGLAPAALAEVDAALTAWGLNPVPPGPAAAGATGGPRPDHAA